MHLTKDFRLVLGVISGSFVGALTSYLSRPPRDLHPVLRMHLRACMVNSPLMLVARLASL
jgi:hypothetical protein